MTQIQVVLHMEIDSNDARQISWWADSPEVDGWTAGGETLAELTVQVAEGLTFYLDDSDLHVEYVMPSPVSTSQGPEGVLRPADSQQAIPQSQGFDVSRLVSA